MLLFLLQFLHDDDWKSQEFPLVPKDRLSKSAYTYKRRVRKHLGVLVQQRDEPNSKKQSFSEKI